MTLRRRRTTWFLTALALLLSPGALAPWLQLQHDCATQAAETAQAQHHHHQDSHQNSKAIHGCQCLGVCQTLSTLAKPAVIQTLELGSLNLTPIISETGVRSRLIPHLHPFALPPPSFS